ncbi:hypothetical protein Pcinc_036804 [Petrolisthes cinctipes]|uniref:Gustatory receptor n=1 Tax=Petrolisthes cinctipes TaxID=88211 RepID=A0AAE1BU02_PETCI|nr:hypothetical protein Pcinc_036804 [Petrolisthes cinctipes]
MVSSGDADEPDYCFRLTAQCDQLGHLIQLFNKVFSEQILVRCLAFFISLQTTLYFSIIHVSNNDMSVMTILNACCEILLFGLICDCASDLQKEVSYVTCKGCKHKALEDAVWELQNHCTIISKNHLPQLDSLAARLHAHSATISIGGLATLGRHTLLDLFNTCVTYIALLFQFRPLVEEYRKGKNTEFDFNHPIQSNSSPVSP